MIPRNKSKTKPRTETVKSVIEKKVVEPKVATIGMSGHLARIEQMKFDKKEVVKSKDVKQMTVGDMTVDVVNPIGVKTVETRKGYIVIQRVKGSDEWQIKQGQVARFPDTMIQAIPPDCPEAFVIELDLPFANK